MDSNSNDGMRLLVTGGAGFIGSNVVHGLLPRPEVARLVVLDCLTYAGHRANLVEADKDPKFSFAKIDLRDAAAVTALVREEVCTHVMHLAAESHVDRSITGPGAFVETNVMGTFNLLEACRESWAGKWAGRMNTWSRTITLYSPARRISRLRYGMRGQGMVASLWRILSHSIACSPRRGSWIPECGENAGLGD